MGAWAWNDVPPLARVERVRQCREQLDPTLQQDLVIPVQLLQAAHQALDRRRLGRRVRFSFKSRHLADDL